MRRNIHRLIVAVMAAVVVLTMGAAASYAASSGGEAKVMMDGKYIEFNADSEPKNVSGRIMVPYRAIFEYLGLEVGYDETTREISGVTPEFTLTMKDGDSSIKLTRSDGTTETKTMDVAPFISNGRTFVPTRFVSEMLGYTVGWDSENKTVIIIDGEKITANAEQDFSTFMKIDDLDTDSGKAYEMDGTISVDITAGGEETTTSGTINGIVEGTDEELNMALKTTADGDIQIVNTQIKFDGSTGDMYIKGEGITETGQWMKLSLSNIMADSGIDLQALLQQSASGVMDITGIFTSILDSVSDDMTITSYDDMTAVYDALKSMFGDSAFKKTGNAYKASFDQTIEDTKVSGDMTINTDSSGKAESYTLKLSAGDSQMTLGIELGGSALSTSVSISADVPGTMTLKMTMDMKLKETSSHPDVSIPSGETVVDGNDLFSSIMTEEAA